MPIPTISSIYRKKVQGLFLGGNLIISITVEGGQRVMYGDQAGGQLLSAREN